MGSQPNRAKLTKGYVDRIRPGAKEEFHWDTEVKGFGLRVTPTGKMTFIVQGRIGTAKEARLSIGPYGVFTVDQARDVAREHLRSMRMGVDPRDLKRQDEAERVTLRQVADAYMARTGKLKESTKTEMNRHVDKVFAAWRDKPIASITERAVRQRHKEMTETGLRGRPAPGQAQISLVTLRTLINFANRRYKRADGSPLIPNNPVKAMKDDWREFEPRNRHIDEGKVGAVWKMLAEARTTARDTDARTGVDLVRFLMLTGARRMEGAALTWDRVHVEDDPAKCWWHLPDPKNKNPVWLPLSSQAVELLRSRPRVKDNPHVFPSRSKEGHITDTRAPLERISKTAEEQLSCHDLRRTFVTVGFTACRIDLFKLELLTNHVPKGVTARHYLKTSRLQYLHKEVQAIGDWVEQQAAIAASENVTRLALHAKAA